MSSLRERTAVKEPRLGRGRPSQLRPADALISRSHQTTSLDTRRAIALVAALGLLAPAFKAWDEIVSVPSTGIAVVALSAGVLWLVGAMAMARTQTQLARLEGWLLVLALLVLAAWTAAMLHGQGGYGTDEAALEQGAASMLLHGHDPYSSNLSTALAAFSTPSKYATYTMNGAIVSSFGYPALPLLVVAPFVELTGGGQAVPVADVVTLMLATVALFKLLPSGWRALSVVLCVAFPILSGFALAGVNAIIVMALLLAPAYRWTSTAEKGVLVRRDKVAAMGLGLALATNQLAWFSTPFLLVGIYLIRRTDLGSARARRVLSQYIGVAAAAFTVVNLPFFLWNPGAWLHGVAAPLTQHAIPYGQGLVDLTLFLHIGGGALDAYNYGAAFLYLALLAMYVIRFRTLGRLCFILPLLPLFVSTRSLGEYWMTLIAVIAVSILTADELAIRSARPLRALSRISYSWQKGAIGALFLPAAICLGVALATPQPLEMRILSARGNDRVDGVQELQVLVRNRSDEPLRPHFATNVTGQAMLWNITQGPAALAPGRAAAYQLLAPDAASMPPNGTTFVLEAFTGSPRTISSSGSFVGRGQAPGYW